MRRFGGVVDNAYAATDRALAPLVAAALARRRHARRARVGSRLGARAGRSLQPQPRAAGHPRAGRRRRVSRDCPPLADPSIYDVAPTLLERLGLPLSGELVGRPLDAAFADTPPDVEVAAYGGAAAPRAPSLRRRPRAAREARSARLRARSRRKGTVLARLARPSEDRPLSPTTSEPGGRRPSRRRPRSPGR